MDALVTTFAQRKSVWVPLVAAMVGALWLRSTGPALTPGGFRPPALVEEVGPAEVLFAEEEGAVWRVDSATGEAVGARAALFNEAQPLDQGWITFTHWTNDGGEPLRVFVTEWEVPPPPASGRGHTLFLFNGLQNRGANYGILQPVLQWGPSAAGGGNYWSIASWYVTTRGQAFHTPLRRVNPGDWLVGEMRLVRSDGGRFAYTSEFRGIPGTRLRLENIAELAWATESLEAYGVRRCSDYPAARDVPFKSILLLTDEHPEMAWEPVNRVTTCGQHAHVVSHSSTDGRVDIRFR